MSVSLQEARQYVKFTKAILDKLGDLIDRPIHLRDTDIKDVAVQLIINQEALDLTQTPNVKYLLTLTQHLYDLYFDLPSHIQIKLYDLHSEIPKNLLNFDYDRTQMSAISPMAKQLLIVAISGTQSQNFKSQLTYEPDHYPHLPIIKQTGGNLYNPLRRVVYLTKSSDPRDPTDLW